MSAITREGDDAPRRKRGTVRSKETLKLIFAVCFLLGKIHRHCGDSRLTDSLYSETQTLALLIDERDEILENLEIAETKYINSFKLSTPDPSIADFYTSSPPREETPPPVPPKPEISRPRPLGNPVCFS